MSSRIHQNISIIIGLSLLLITVGCSTKPISIQYDPKLATVPPVSMKGPATIIIHTYKDARQVAPSRKIGDIKATVSGVYTTELILDKDISTIVTEAFESQFSLAGFNVLKEKGLGMGNANFSVEGTIREFRLDIGPQDEIAIEVETKIADTRTGQTLWAGVVSEKDKRFAGSFGNSRTSITSYINIILAKVVGKTMNEINESIKKTNPDLFQPVPVVKTPQGVTVLVEPPPVPQPSNQVQENKVTGGKGRVNIVTTPGRAKVYIGEVYYGLSPLNLELDHGIYEISVKLKGFKVEKEKVSIRKGDVTELEFSLEKE